MKNVIALILTLAGITVQAAEPKSSFQDLLHIQEEEKLAKDVYLKLYAKWKLRPFKNIAERGETNHIAMIAEHVKKLGLESPLKKEPGNFTDEKIKDLYDKLVKYGSESLKNAVCVGLEIEELDIKDLNTAIANEKDENLKETYSLLRSGSYRHLNAFMRQARRLGITYKPKHLAETEFNSILSK